MNAEELRALTPGELATRVAELQQELFTARLQNYTNQLDDTTKLRRLRREIARVKTVLGETTSGEAAKDA